MVRGRGGREHTSMRLQCCRLHPPLHFLSVVGNKTDRHISSAAINGRSLWTVEDLSIKARDFTWKSTSNKDCPAGLLSPSVGKF